MKIGEIWDRYKDYTEELSKNFRTLALAAAAICWFFKSPQITFPKNILFALIFIVAFFICDILHYGVGAVVTRLWVRRKEKELHEKKIQITRETEVEQPAWLDVGPLVFFLGKGFWLLLSYVEIGKELLKKILDP
jgi:hypothetical protein